jgi:hypothetical protein
MTGYQVVGRALELYGDHFQFPSTCRVPRALIVPPSRPIRPIEFSCEPVGNKYKMARLVRRDD